VTRTYVDAGVLIAVARGNQPGSFRAVGVLEDPRRTFVASAFLRLEVLPKAQFHRNQEEVALYETFFAGVSAWAEPIERVLEMAEREAARYGLNALDALHVAAAIILGADELVTTEGLTKPMHRVTAVRIVAT